MKKLFFSLMFLIFITYHLFSQNNDTIGLEPQFVRNLINQQFGNLINPQSKNIIGNFASLDPKDPEVNFAGNIIFKKGSILGIKVKAQINDGFVPIFSNTELNSNIGLSIQYNLLNPNDVIQYNDTIFQNYKKAKNNILHDYELKKIGIDMNQKKILADIEINKLKKELDKADATLKALKDSVSNGLIKYSLSCDSLSIEIEKANFELEAKKENLNSINIDDQIYDIELTKAIQIVNLRATYKINGFKISWFSFGGGINNSSFRLFNPVSAYGNQISRESFLSYNCRVQYSIYNKSAIAFESYYFSIGTELSKEDNHLSLSTVEINETKNYGPNPNDRYINSKYNAYKGTYKRDLYTLSFYSDFYYFLFNDNMGGVHFYPEFSASNNLSAVTNFGFGFLLTFKNVDESKNVINSEFYINLLNIFGNNNPVDNLWKRSSYGIRFTFPINFNSKL